MNFEPRNFTSEEKKCAKKKILQVSRILRKWSSILPEFNILEIKKAFLSGKVLSDSSDWLIDQNIIKDFQNKIDPDFGETVEFAVLRSFIKMCKKYARLAANRVENQTGLNSFSVYEDLLQDAIGIVLHSMYYYTKKDIELSTFVGNSLKNGLNRSIRYNHCTTSPISVEDNQIKIKLLELIRNNPGYSLNEIVESMGKDYGLKDESKIRDLLARVVRERPDQGFLQNVPCVSSPQEDLECLDTLNFLKSLFSPKNQEILNLSDQEVELLRFGVSSNFERGWQTKYADKASVSRQRVGQVYESAVKKVRPILAKVCG